MADESDHAFSIVRFQCKLKDEYYQRNRCEENEALHGTHQANILVTQSQHLSNQISKNIAPMICKNCNRCRHATDDCRHLGKLKCTNCNQFEHLIKECYSTWKHKQDHESLSTQRGNANKCTYKMCKTIQSSQVAENVNEELAVFIEEVISSPPNNSYKDDEELCLINNLDVEDLVNYSEYKKTASSNYIMCLVDSGTMSHIFREEGFFLNYRPIKNMYVGKVRGAQSCIKGKETVILLTTHETRNTKIKLQDVTVYMFRMQNIIWSPLDHGNIRIDLIMLKRAYSHYTLCKGKLPSRGSAHITIYIGCTSRQMLV